MNRERAKEILILYRPGTADVDDPELSEALGFMRQDDGLRRWFEDHCAVQQAIRAGFRQIAVPEGLKEQIISERPVVTGFISRRRTVVLSAAAAISVLVLMLLMSPWLRPRGEDTLAVYRSRMVKIALLGYSMDLETNNPVPINAFLAQTHAPANFAMPDGLRRMPVTGCAVVKWQGDPVSMICFRTAKPLPPGEKSDLWLFVANRASLKDAPPPGAPQILKVSRLITAIWTQGDKVYLLGTEGDEQTIRRYL